VPNNLGLPDWFPDDFAADDTVYEELAGDFVTGSEEGGIAVQMGLADAEGITGQLIDLSRTPAWVNEKRAADGQWTRGGTSPARRAMVGGASHSTSSVAIRQAQANRQAATTAVAERVAEVQARKALEDAKAEVEKVAEQLKQEAKDAEDRKHRVKLAVHALLVVGGAILAAILAHYDVSPAIAALSGAFPLLAIELTDWRKKL